MHSEQMKIWVDRVDQQTDSPKIWTAMEPRDRTQIARLYAKAIGKAARVRHDNAASGGEEDANSNE